MNYIEKDVTLLESVKIHNLLPKIGIEKARQEIIEGLKAESKYISPKYFYNKEGGALFEKITKLNEYYPTRCEKEILSDLFTHLDINLENYDIIELGSGDASKISLLLKQLSLLTLETINYFALDIDQAAIEKSIQQIASKFNVNCTGIVSDFYHELKLIPSNRKRLFCFFGSTIGNFMPQEAEKFLTQLGSILQKGDMLLLGADLIKDISTLERAYNDKKRVTEAFNRNILNTVNSLIASNFNPFDFEHLAFYNAEKARIEMHLKAMKDVEIKSKYLPEPLCIKKGECIHTENSHKFNANNLNQIAEIAELSLEKIFFDAEKRFSLSCFIK